MSSTNTIEATNEIDCVADLASEILAKYGDEEAERVQFAKLKCVNGSVPDQVLYHNCSAEVGGGAILGQYHIGRNRDCDIVVGEHLDPKLSKVVSNNHCIGVPYSS